MFVTKHYITKLSSIIEKLVFGINFKKIRITKIYCTKCKNYR